MKRDVNFVTMRIMLAMAALDGDYTVELLDVKNAYPPQTRLTSPRAVWP